VIIDTHVHICFYTAPPQITINPSDKTVQVNNRSTSVTFTCMANGALSYYWQKDNVTIASNAEGIRNNILMLHNIQPTINGCYRCVAVNDHGRTYSNPAMLIVKGTINKCICT